MSGTSTLSRFTFTGSQQALLDQAVARAGHEDFGGDDFRDGFERLVSELDRAKLSPAGSQAVRHTIVANLASRLKAFAGFKARPDAMARPIVRPLVIAGIVRSGTTALHKLLSMDPQFQGIEHWLCASPQPRPPRAEWEANADFRESKAVLDAMIAISPELATEHGMAVDTVEESLNVLAHCFASNMYPSMYDIPEYDAWYRGIDDTFAYRYFADVLRLVGADTPGRTWLLKNPTDAYSMQQVLNVFPDAMIVQTHRDPVQAVPSIVNLIGGAQRQYRGADVDYGHVFRRELDFDALAMQRADATKDKYPGRVFDVQFKDFVTDQMGVVERIYAHFGLTLSAGAEAAMRGWLEANPRRPGALQRWTAEDFGGSSDEIRERFAAYRARYGYSG